MRFGELCGVIASELRLSKDLSDFLLVVHISKFLNGSDWFAALGGREFKFIIERN